jgi:hypothetical protein
MRDTRQRMSPAARATSRAIKSDNGRSVEYMVDRKTKQLIQNATAKPNVNKSLLADSPEWQKYIELEKAGAADALVYQRAVEELGARPVVSRAIIQSAGSPNPFVTKLLRYVARPGAAALGTLGVVDMVTNIVNAEEGQRFHVAAKELGGFAGGIVGGEAGSMGAVWIASLIVSSSGVLLVVSFLGSLIGAAVGAQVGSLMNEVPALLARGPGLVAKTLMPMGASITGGGFAGMMDRDHRMQQRGGVTSKLEDHLFEIDNRVRALEHSISEAKDRATLERLQVERLAILDGREVYDRLFQAVRSGEIDEKQLFDIVEENDL